MEEQLRTEDGELIIWQSTITESMVVDLTEEEIAELVVDLDDSVERVVTLYGIE